MKTTKMEMYGVILAIAGMLLASVFNPEDIRASILSGIDEPTGSVYDDLYLAEEANVTITSGLNQTANNTESQR